MKIGFLNDRRFRLGESPVWDHRRGWLWWVDSIEGRILAATENGAVQRDWRFAGPVGSVALAADGLVAAFADQIALVREDGSVDPLDRPAIGDAQRFNDGKADRQGRFLTGTLQMGEGTEARGSVWRIGPGRTACRVEQGLRLTNALCFSPAGDWLYLADSLEGIIRRYPYDPETGALGARQDFVDCRSLSAVPDGATVDSEGRLWVALVDVQALACFSPEGKLLDRIALPIPFPSCPAFGGPAMDRLYLTAISDSGHRLKSDDPDAGRVMVIEGLGVTGLPEAICTFDNHIRN